MPTSRREFLQTSTVSALALAAAPALSARAAEAPANKVVIGIMGLNTRGAQLAPDFIKTPGVEIAYVCDVDSHVVEKRVAEIEKLQGKKPEGITDFHKMLDDKAVDAVVVSAPDHWHAPATILACAAGKNVYCEKPASHNGHEGQLMIAAARKYDRVVQIGTQRRSMPTYQEAIQKMHDGKIGNVYLASCSYINQRPSIGKGKVAAVPEWLDYKLWQGPAPQHDYRDNLIHYNWHWFWNWGTGELGNNGVHSLDVCRWGLDVGYPTRVTCGGGKYNYIDDDQQTPDTHLVTFDYGDKSIHWQGLSRSRHAMFDQTFSMIFYGDKGTLLVGDAGYTFLDPKDKEMEKGGQKDHQISHIQNFVDCIRDKKRPNADVEVGVTSTTLCHLGNIAYRTGRTVNFDPAKKEIIGDSDALKFWSREYRPGWEPKV